MKNNKVRSRLRLTRALQLTVFAQMLRTSQSPGTLSKIVAEGEPLERKSFKKAHEKGRVIRWELTKKYLTASLGS